MKNTLFTLFSIILLFTFISCASKESTEYDYTYDYTLDEEAYITEGDKQEVGENFLANIDPVYLPSLFFLKKSGKNMVPREVHKVAIVPRTNAVEWHFRDGGNEIAIILRKAERDKIFDACNQFLEKYESKTLEHTKVSRKNAYFVSKCSVWFGLISPATGCEANTYYVAHEFVNKRPYLLIRFLPTHNTDEEHDAYTPKISLYMSPSQIRDFLEQMSQEELEAAIQANKQKAYTY